MGYHIVMIKLKKYKSVDENKFNELLIRHMANDTSFAHSIGQTQGSIGMKRTRNFTLSFAQSFAFYASYYMSSADLDFVIEQMRQDGFEVELND